MKNIKIALVGVHGTGKSGICERVLRNLRESYTEKTISDLNPYGMYHNIFQESDECVCNLKYNLKYIPEQFREILNDLFNQSGEMVKQTEETTLATYAKQLYLESLYAIQGKNILCDRSVLDTFVYYNYFFCSMVSTAYDYAKKCEQMCIVDIKNRTHQYNLAQKCVKLYSRKSYSKIYLIEPSDREIEDDGFRLTDKKQQLEIHQLFLEYFKDFDNVEIVNQDNANKEEFVEKIANYFI